MNSTPPPLEFLLGAPDWPFEAALDTAIAAAVTAWQTHTITNPDTNTASTDGPAMVWFGVPPRAGWLETRHARSETWSVLSLASAESGKSAAASSRMELDGGIGAQLPQPPGRVADVVVMAFALTAVATPAVVPGFVLRMLRNPDTAATVVIIDRVRTPAAEFVPALDPWAGPAHLSAAERLRWLRAWSPYTAADFAWLLPFLGMRIIDAHEIIGLGRRFLVAHACPATQPINHVQ